KETLADRLRLPTSPGELLEKRDKNLDRMLSLKEFSDEKSPVVRRRLEEAFTQFDLDENGRIILSELEEVYRKM
ncbi:hypothetical protein N9894_03890, partial [Akkermansiaceae bacterium]|nr:hypothetical protein [Akkermansiaceae bacterium]